jgi:RNA polymerase sigma factor (sigma-70 family)
MGKKRDIAKEFEVLYGDHSDALFRHCYFRVYSRERALELVQETFTRMWVYVSGEQSIDNPRAFLYRILNNLIIDEYRKKKSESLDRLLEDGFEPSENGKEDIYTAADAREVVSLLQELDEEDRKLITMRFLDDLSPKEIALIVGQTENNVSVRLHRAIKKMRKQYNI